MGNSQGIELLSVNEVCEEYGVGRTMVYEMLNSGQLPARIIGKRGTRILRADVEACLLSLPRYIPNASQTTKEDK